MQSFQPALVSVNLSEPQDQVNKLDIINGYYINIIKINGYYRNIILDCIPCMST